MLNSDFRICETLICGNFKSIDYAQKSLFNPAPVIISAPRDSYGPLGANLTLDCEARGFPAPTITWQFHSNEGKTYNLPSERCLKFCGSKLLICDYLSRPYHR